MSIDMTSRVDVHPHTHVPLADRVKAVGREVSKFGVVGLAGLVVDLGVFNLLRYVGADGEGVLFDKPLTAKALAVLVATMVTFAGNLLWTYRHRRDTRRKVAHGYALFFLFNAIGMGFSLVCLGVSHYLMGLTSPIADNISANVVGLAMGTVFRFWAYRKWVFRS